MGALSHDYSSSNLKNKLNTVLNFVSLCTTYILVYMYTKLYACQGEKAKSWAWGVYKILYVLQWYPSELYISLHRRQSTSVISKWTLSFSSQEAVWTISNITAGQPHQIQCVVDTCLMPAIIDVMIKVNHMTTTCKRKGIGWSWIEHQLHQKEGHTTPNLGVFLVSKWEEFPSSNILAKLCVFIHYLNSGHFSLIWIIGLLTFRGNIMLAFFPGRVQGTERGSVGNQEPHSRRDHWADNESCDSWCSEATVWPAGCEGDRDCHYGRRHPYQHSQCEQSTADIKHLK